MESNYSPSSRESVSTQVELLTIEQILSLLNKKFNNQYFRELLIMKLFSFKDDDIDFYLPQIWLIFTFIHFKILTKIY